MSTYKLDEPMTWESFKAMPEDLQKQYIVKLQESYQATDVMIGKMFGISGWSVGDYRKKLGIGTINRSGLSYDDLKIRNAKWDAFCNGVVGGKPGEVKEPDEHEKSDQIDVPEVETTEIETDVLEVEPPDNIIIPDRVSVTFVVDACDIDKAFERFKPVSIPEGKVRIRFEIEAV